MIKRLFRIWRWKKLDRMIFTSFIPPFIAAFSVALFVLLMQMLWIYIDNLAGRGLGFFTILELLSYKAIGFVPMALPLGVLLSSVMLMGNLAEHYELSSMKSAGMSLLRIMRPLIIFSVCVCLTSWYCSDYIIPAANLQFGSRMWDINNTKPALRLDVGVFNDDFQNFTIHIGKKGNDGRSIKDVIIYDQSESNSGKFVLITAKDGEMYTAEGGNTFVMRLRDGFQYIESRNYNGTSQSKYPFIRTGFDEFTKIFDLSEFQMGHTNMELFKNSRQTMDSKQLRAAADSMQLDIEKRIMSVGNFVSTQISILPFDSTFLKAEMAKAKANQTQPVESNTTQGNIVPLQNASPASTGVTFDSSHSVTFNTDHSAVSAIPATYQSQIPKRVKPINLVKRFADTFSESDRINFKNRAESSISSVLNQTLGAAASLDNIKENQVKFIFDWQSKYSTAVACFIFMFIGAPMGAIVRKGGFGYPFLVSVIFFVFFVIMTIFCHKIAESFVVNAYLAAWIPCLVLFPISLLLTIKAMNDRTLQFMEPLQRGWSKLYQWYEQKRARYKSVKA